MSNDNMIRVAGEDMVTAEERKDMSEGFGKTDWNDDKRLHIPFKDFINKVTTGKVYMTTQDIPLSEYDGGPIKRMGTHIQKLIDNKLIPKNPSILEDTGLTQYQVNMWFGDAKDGRKIFRIYSPDAITQGLNTNGVRHRLLRGSRNNGEEEEEEEEAQLDKLLDIAIAEGNFDDDDDEEEEEEEGPEGKKRKVVMEEELKTQGPSHFCNTTIITIDHTGDIMYCIQGIHNTISNSSSEIHGEYVEVELLPGDMLYLPASYFHEVISYSSTQGEEKEGGGHLAVNYWYHPPVYGGTYDKPYVDNYWSDRWDTILLA
ncbi:conserved hypothetical protein [Perkinsus marinus ATCC 50983]|uniref:Cupin-like domain-containing protein n=1 Tax=Perkinsus marinus (strain ATCC 50983 / TXsc) TaxID=423536 RepID=C5LCU5_PERM5|nr:conserved hypothetical protein [Perkinsus marinus ATCC 50983]EER05448.1 conserved hypothetical protein [Perkinsus marinus ATCC 50983]|eukprot:XP_002773632.1 conserved hypothetical protein [Perkinsus marinus ATCC 50983]